MADAQTEAYRLALKQARESFDRATERLNKISLESYTLNEETAKLRRTITALAAMCSESPWLDELGITPSCVEAMEAEKDEVTTQNVVNRLKGMGFDFSSQKSPSASVHSILSRLARDKKIEKITAEDGSVTWRGPKYRPPANDYADQGITDEDIPF